jgi:hypothetical protein
MCWCCWALIAIALLWLTVMVFFVLALRHAQLLDDDNEKEEEK